MGVVDVISSLASWGIGFIGSKWEDTLSEKIDEKIDEKILSKKIEDYFNYRKEIHEEASSFDEYYFDGVLEYIKNNLQDEIYDYLFDMDAVNKKERLGIIKSKVINYSEAQDRDAKERAFEIIMDIIQIVHEFFISKCSPEERALAADLSSSIVYQTTAAIKSGNSQVIKSINNIIDYTPGRFAELARTGDYILAETKIRQIFNAMNAEHPLDKYYSLGFVNGKLVSEPQNTQALIKYPPRLVGEVSLMVNGVGGFSSLDQAEKYAYIHQEEIEIRFDKVIKMLGDTVDPIQVEAREMNGIVLRKEPQPFPKAESYRIEVEDDILYDNIMLRVNEIKDDGTVIISNSEEKKAYVYIIEVNPSTKNVRVSSSISGASNYEMLIYSKFMYAVSSGSVFKIIGNKDGSGFLRARPEPFELKTGFGSLVEEIDFLERICEMENYFKKDINITDQLSSGEYDFVIYVSDLIRGKKIKSSWNVMKLEGRVDKQLREWVNTLEQGSAPFCVTATKKILLFGEEFLVTSDTRYNSLKFVNYEKLKSKISYSDDGDLISFEVGCGDDNTRIESLVNNDRQLITNSHSDL